MVVVTDGRGWVQATLCSPPTTALIEGLDRVLQYHSESLNLGYLAYLAFYEFCRRAFPDSRDEAVSQMVTGIDVVVVRPDEELKAACPARARARDRSGRQGGGDRGSPTDSAWRQRSRSAIARRIRAREGSVVLLFVRQWSLESPPLVDRRCEAADRDGGLVHRPPRGRRDDLAPARGRGR